MCGIAGIFEYSQQKKVTPSELNQMSEHMRLRGPDGAGFWTNPDESLGFVHRRLSIIDLSTDANQPLHDGVFTIVFNGEIYNYKKCRDDLMQKGYLFKTHSDTEVILKLYHLHGVGMLNLLRGMFAFSIWDEKNKTLFCARDPFGIKPFYYSDNGKCFRFASQVKTLLSASSTEINTTLSAAGQVGFFLLGSVPEPYTLYEGIQSLPSGQYLLIDAQGKKIQKEFYNIKSAFIHAENNTHTTHTSLQACLYDTVQHHLIADVDVGIFLSSGIDSSTLVNVASDIAPKPTTITLGFEEYRGTLKDEVSLAERVADLFKTHQKTKWLSEKIAQEQREKIFAQMDQPSIDGINTYFVSWVANQLGMKVALSGLGSDELFAGYPHFSRIAKLTKYVSAFSCVGKIFRQATKKILSPKEASLLEYSRDCSSAYFLARALHMPWELENFLDKDLVKTGLEELNLFERLKNDCEGIRSKRFQISALDIQWYMRNQLLRDSDWASMSHSLEIRVPFVDVTFFENVIALCAKKPLSKKELANAPHRKLPVDILNRQKTGFNIPVSQWFSQSDNMKDFSRVLYKNFI